MVSKKLLSAAIAAAFISVPAFALDMGGAGTTGAAPSGALKYAKEAVVDANEDAGFLTVQAGTNELDVQVAIGFGVTDTTHAFIRFNLTNAKFKSAVNAADLTALSGTITNVTVAQGGAPGQDYVIFDVTSGGLSQTDKLNLALADLEVSTTSPVTIGYAHYATSPNSVAQSGALSTDSFPSAITVVNAVSATFTPGTTATAEVSADFTEFLGASTSETLGTVTFAADTSVLLPSGDAITNLTALTDLVDDASDLVLAGDLSFGDFELDGCAIDSATGSLAEGGDCVVTDFAFNTTYDFSVSVDGETTIVPGSYTATVDYVKLDTGLFNPVDASGVVGNIARNGTSVKVPFVNVNPSFNQRIIIVNRSNVAVPLTISDVIADAEATGFALTTAGQATIMLPANKQTVLKSSELFQVAAGSASNRGAATLNIAAPMSKVDVLFQSTNSEGAQNTVILQTDGQKFGGNDPI